MRRSGKEPSRVNLASYFSSALDPDHSLHGGPQVIPEVRGCPKVIRSREQKMIYVNYALSQKVLLHTDSQ